MSITTVITNPAQLVNLEGMERSVKKMGENGWTLATSFVVSDIQSWLRNYHNVVTFNETIENAILLINPDMHR